MNSSTSARCTWKLSHCPDFRSIFPNALTPTISPVNATSGPPLSPGRIFAVDWITRPRLSICAEIFSRNSFCEPSACSICSFA